MNDSADGRSAHAREARIDAHQHVWNLERSPYRWLASSGLTPIRRTIRFEDGECHLNSADLDGAILVQADDTDADTDYMLEVAERSSRVVGVVGWIPLDAPRRAAQRLDEIMSPALVGIRALIHDMPDPDWILGPAVSESLRLLEQHDLSFDFVAVTPRHLENAVTLGRRHPGLRIVIDHLAKPPIGRSEREPWWTLIGRAAAEPNIVAKLSGLYSATGNAASWTIDGIGPFIERALDVFGADRLMFGSDWPFSIPAGDFPRTWGATTHHLASLSFDERASILGGAATRHYRLDPSRIRAMANARGLAS